MGSCMSKGPETTGSSIPNKNANAKRQQQKVALNGSASNIKTAQESSSSTGEKSTDIPSNTNGSVTDLNGAITAANASTNTSANTVAKPGVTNTTSSSSSTDKNVKVLLLGSGESGKSTIVKQMKIIHQNGYSKEEIYEYKPFVYRNVLECIKNIINAIIDLEPDLIKNENGLEAIKSKEEEIYKSNNNNNSKNKNNTNNNINEKLTQNDQTINEIENDDEGDALDENNEDLEVKGLDYDEKLNGTHTNSNNNNNNTNNTNNTKATKIIIPVLDYDELSDILDYELSMDTDEPFDQNIAKKIIHVYSKPEVQDFIKYQQGNFYLIDSTSYFLGDLERISEPDYMPSVNDILRTRKKTSGIFDFKFQMSSGLNIHMYDVGGQRSERKKWIHCFDNVTLIIFCVALSEYDQVLLEENSQNRLVESLTLFDSVVNSRWFSRTSIVLFLNKIDVFAEKLPYSPLENHFPDYTGGKNINKAAKYILWRFTQVNRSGLNIYPHVTQATDTSNIQLVFAAVKETILENLLRDSGLL
ncbi:guanine nucleotide-binding protein alpha-2 subunit [[Candida] railenensis]|uniref:Guanine nucleotide-binding protein alpha-2 subunit n=1 Tax=[Candida] railenensis TaxID=45579 RepID=A0A9P0VY86_9ASCO|nr:guanine nucleotide-binding protein alpha-2 subunit [[Candida] railenensis]